MVVGIFIIGRLVNGIRVSTKDGFEISVDRQKLPTELDIEGDWYCVAETNNDTKFTEDGCRKRIGTASIKQKEGTPEVILNGRKLLRAECGYANTQITGTAHLQFLKGQPEARRVEYQWALNIFCGYPDYDSFTRMMTNLITELACAYVETSVRDYALANQHVQNAWATVRAMPNSPGSEMLKAQVSQAEDRIRLAAGTPKSFSPPLPQLGMPLTSWGREGLRLAGVRTALMTPALSTTPPIRLTYGSAQSPQ